MKEFSMKKYCIYLVLSSLITTHMQMAETTVPLTKPQIALNALKYVGNKGLVLLSPIGRGVVFAGQKLTQNKIVFISTGIVTATGLSWYLNSEKIKDSYKPKALFGTNKSFNPLTSHFIQKMVENVKNGFNIWDTARIFFGLNPAIKTQEINFFSKNETLEKEKQDLCNKYTNDTAELNQKILTLTKDYETTKQNSNENHRNKDLLIADLKKEISKLTDEKNKLTITLKELKELQEKNLKEDEENKIKELNLKIQEINIAQNRITEIEKQLIEKDTEINELTKNLNVTVASLDTLNIQHTNLKNKFGVDID